MRRPVSPGTPITQGYGKTSFSNFHNGIDWSGRYNRTVYAPEAGKVAYNYQPTLGGNVLIIYGATGEHRLAHLERYLVGNGTRVTEGFPVGIMGATGVATGIHLHSAIKINGQYVNPLPYYDRVTISADMPTRDEVARVYRVIRGQDGSPAEIDFQVNNKATWASLIFGFEPEANAVRSAEAEEDKFQSVQIKQIADLQAIIDGLNVTSKTTKQELSDTIAKAQSAADDLAKAQANITVLKQDIEELKNRPHYEPEQKKSFIDVILEFIRRKK